MLLGLLKKGDPEVAYVAHVTSSDSAARVKSALGDLAGDGVTITHGEDEAVNAVQESDVVFLCVQPKDLNDLLSIEHLAESMGRAVVISTLAGVSVERVRRAFGNYASHQSVARVIPTLGATNGDSVTLLAEPSHANDHRLFGRAECLLSQIGSVVRVPESLMNSATAIGAAVHALAIVAIDAATDASVAAGMPRDIARAIAAESLRSGSGLMCGEEGMTAEQVKAAMSTPGGITLNAVVNLDAGARPGIASAVKSAVEYTDRMNN